jgi:hypothetical protein
MTVGKITFDCGGENVCPIEVEDLLMRHPAVADVSAVALSHAVKGDAPVAMLVPKRHKCQRGRAQVLLPRPWPGLRPPRASEVHRSDAAQEARHHRSPLALAREGKLKPELRHDQRGPDNVFIERLSRSLKYDCIYLNAFETGSEERTGIGGG